MKQNGPDWSSFGPDIIVGIVTGITVGIALFILELLWRSRTRAASDREVWLPRMERLAALLSYELEYESDSFRAKKDRTDLIQGELVGLSSIHRSLNAEFREVFFLKIIADNLLVLAASVPALERALKVALREHGGHMHYASIRSMIVRSDPDHFPLTLLGDSTDQAMSAVNENDEVVGAVSEYNQARIQIDVARRAFVDYRTTLASRLWNEEPPELRVLRFLPEWIRVRIAVARFMRFARHISNDEFERRSAIYQGGC